MLRVVAAQLKHRVGRGIALLLAIFVAVTSFTILTGTTEVSQLEVVGSVEENFRSAYDILVRPAGETTDLEAERDMVRNNFLSGLSGGITMDQYETIKAIRGIEVAAPLAVLGYQGHPVGTQVAFEPYIDPTQPRQVFRIRTTLTTDRGLSQTPGTVGYAYFTTNPLSNRTGNNGDHTVESFEDGHSADVCPSTFDLEREDPFDRTVASFVCFSPADDRLPQQSPEPYPTWIEWPVSFLLTAIDPEQEARLAGLDEAVIDGRYLRSSDEPRPEIGGTRVPVLLASELVVDEQLDVVVERLPAEATGEMTGGLDPVTLQARLAAVPGVEVGRETISGRRAVDGIIASLAALGPNGWMPMTNRWSVGPVDYEVLGDDHLRPRPIDVPDDRWAPNIADWFIGTGVPWSAEDVAYRPPELHEAAFASSSSPGDVVSFVGPEVVGTFDPGSLPAWSELSALPMETYSPPGAVGWDERSRQLLGDDSLLPSSNPAGYLGSPPLMLTSLSSLDVLLDPENFSGTDPERPIGAIRVRVAHVTGPDDASRERVRLAAEEIVHRTGLDVDVTVGSSPRPLRIDLGGGRFGRPELSMREEWVQKGVAVAILDALDRKSLVLFGLILGVTCLVLANASAAAVRARRTELGILACIGWSSRSLYGAVIGELLVIGVVAGGLAALSTPVVAATFDIEVPVSRAWIPVGASLILTVLAGLWPANRAARTQPAAAVRPPVAPVRVRTQQRRVMGLAATNLLRAPGRSLLGAFSLAVGVCALTVVMAATLAFHNVLVGSLLGEAISIKVRGVDYIAVGTVLGLGAFAVGDVLYLNVRERAHEFAALQATGWTTGHVARLVVYEGLLIGLLGAVMGAAVGLIAAGLFAAEITSGLWLTTAAAVAAGTALAAAAAVVPARLPARLPLAQLLAEE